MARGASDYAAIASENMGTFGKAAIGGTISLITNAPAIALSIAGLPQLGALYSAALVAGQDVAQQNLMGVSAWEALGHATMMAGIEYFMSRLPFDSLKKMATGKLAVVISAKVGNKIGATVLTYGANVLIQMSTEFCEEVATSLVSNIADIAIAGEKSRYMQTVRANMANGLPYEEACAAAMQLTWQNALYEGYAGLWAGGISSIAATAVGLRQVLKKSVDTLANSSDAPPQRRKLLSAMSEDMATNPIDITPEGDTNTVHTDGDTDIQIFSEGDADTQHIRGSERGNADINEDASSAQADGEANTFTEQDITEGIRQNLDNPKKAEGVQAALTEGMTALIGIEARLKRDSGNTNYAGFSADTSHNAYMDFISNKGDMGTTAQAIAADISSAIVTGQLSASEINQLQSVLAGLTGDADLAAEYVGQVTAAASTSDKPGNGGMQNMGDFMPTDDGIMPNIDEGEESGYNRASKSENQTVTYRRVQGGTPPNASRVRVTIDLEGKIKINNKSADLNISIDNGEHANYFRSRRGQDAHIIAWEVPKWFDDLLRENAIDQHNYRTNPDNQGGVAPKIVDKGTPGLSYELSNPWLNWLEEYSVDGRYEK